MTDEKFRWFNHLLVIFFSSSFILIQTCFTVANVKCHQIFTGTFDPYESHLIKFNESQRLAMREEARKMFQFGYDNYMRYAFPLDELDPIHCLGRGPDYENPSNININDVLGDYSLTLIDSLTTLVVMGNKSEFVKAVQNVIDFVSFERDNTVQVFEANIRLGLFEAGNLIDSEQLCSARYRIIADKMNLDVCWIVIKICLCYRVLGALLSAHMIITDPNQRLGDFRIPDYNDELLSLAHDLADRLLPAFEGTKTGIPFPRVIKSRRAHIS